MIKSKPKNDFHELAFHKKQRRLASGASATSEHAVSHVSRFGAHTFVLPPRGEVLRLRVALRDRWLAVRAVREHRGDLLKQRGDGAPDRRVDLLAHDGVEPKDSTPTTSVVTREPIRYIPNGLILYQPVVCENDATRLRRGNVRLSPLRRLQHARSRMFERARPGSTRPPEIPDSIRLNGVVSREPKCIVLHVRESNFHVFRYAAEGLDDVLLGQRSDHRASKHVVLGPFVRRRVVEVVLCDGEKLVLG
mmetsp:Transcript_14538/g.30492  ORF Transcript_14538/g.30492 Transcript_14538/m.30492 type:complete len:249 (-) Transcript_14538:179-925(-)